MYMLYIPDRRHVKHSNNLRQCIGKTNNLLVKQQQIQSLAEITLLLRNQKLRGINICGIAVSDLSVIGKYLYREYGTEVSGKDEATLQNYAGAMFSHSWTTPEGTPQSTPVVVINNPEFIAFNAAEEHLATHYLSKLHDPSWFTMPKMEYSVTHTWAEVKPFLELATSSAAVLCGVDIETVQKELPAQLIDKTEVAGIPLAGVGFHGYKRTKAGTKSKTSLAYLAPIITMVGYCLIYKTSTGGLASKTLVVPMDTMEHVAMMRMLNLTDVPKVMHNGRYDANYFLRYNAPLRNWTFDTYIMMHCWQVELRRTLHATCSYVIRNHMYWKDESDSNAIEYNAKDCHNTAWACLALLEKWPEYAVTNYVSIFKQVFPCITCELEGFLQDPVESVKLWQHYQEEIAKSQSWWDKVLLPNFNVRSITQVRTLFNTVLKTGIKDTSRKTLEGLQHKHPLWRLVVDKLLETRQYLKADATYMNIITFNGRILYGIDPSGTDTGRYASKESNFWCGTQIQNIPFYAKSMFIADEGWELSSIDNAQSESRTTAYITGDDNLIDAVENSKDFHTRNASLFFGIPEDELWELKAKDFDKYKVIRNDIGKRVNHGANYNMGAGVLIQTMTVFNVIKAKVTLKLPADFTFQQVATYLLSCFDKAYPRIRSTEEGGYHRALIDEVKATGCLRTPDNWVRRTYMRPWHSKPELNSIVAHKPQSWSVRIINRAFFDAWYKYQYLENKCRMKAQVHDEIVYQTKPEDTEYVTAGISLLMKRPNPYTAATTGMAEDGMMVIPNDPSKSKLRWNELK